MQYKYYYYKFWYGAAYSLNDAFDKIEALDNFYQ